MYKPENEELRKMMKILFVDPQPDWVTPVEGQPNTYEFFASGLWIRYQIETNGEMVLVAAVTNRPSFL